MARKQSRLYLDKVERKFLEQIKAKKPEYADLDLEQVAHIELKNHLFAFARDNKGLSRFLSHEYWINKFKLIFSSAEKSKY